MKTYLVYVYFHPKEKGARQEYSNDLWLGYTGWGRNGSSACLFGGYYVKAQTRAKAIAAAIAYAKKEGKPNAATPPQEI